MAKKKQAKVAEIRELDKTVVVNDNIYKINAVEADHAVASDHALEADHAAGATHAVDADNAKKVNKKLIINEIGHNNTTVTDFDGSEEKTISIVPASGGKFDGRITVPVVSDDVLEADSDTVINYTDIVGRVVNKLINTSTMATWDSTTGKLTFLNDAPSINGLCVVKGTESDLSSFSTANNNSKWLPDYLYICIDTGNIYLGASSSSDVTRLAASTVKLDTICSITTDLASADSAEFNGTSPSITPGVVGVLREVNGGTGVDSLDKATVGKASQLANAIRIYTNLETTKDTGMLFDGSSETFIGVSGVLAEANGGTGKQSLADVTVGHATNAVNATKASQDASGNVIANYYQKKITISPNNPSGGSNGDIWITY